MNVETPLEQWRILAVDDEPEVLYTYSLVLSDAMSERKVVEPEQFDGWNGGEQEKLSDGQRFELETARNGMTALRKVDEARAEGCPFSVVLVDMRMPGGWNGLETADQIRKIDSEVQIVFVTAYSDFTLKEMRDRINSRFQFLRKPFDQEELYQLVLSLSVLWSHQRRLLQVVSDLTEVE